MLSQLSERRQRRSSAARLKPRVVCKNAICAAADAAVCAAVSAAVSAAGRAAVDATIACSPTTASG